MHLQNRPFTVQTTIQAMQTPYIPSRNADFANWLANFASLLTAAPATYGSTAPVALEVQTAADTFAAAFELSTNPATRTSPTVAATNAAKADALLTVRPVAVQISRNPAVTDENKLTIGVNLPNPSRTPVPPPTDAPSLTLESASPGVINLRTNIAGSTSGKAKPAGAVGIELRGTYGTAPAVDPTAAAPLTTLTKSPAQIATNPARTGQLLTLWGRYVTRSGPGGMAQAGPWSAALTVVVM